jgi:hypothetical protein
MSHAVGIGYDWLYKYLDKETGEKIRTAIIEKGMKPGLQVIEEKKDWWARSDINWNMVCNSGLVIGALAIAETDPEYVKILLPNAVKSMPRAIKSYGPDGAWMEGPGYWHYATRYTAYGLCAMETALGTDFGLSQIKGLDKAGLFPIYTTGPTNYMLNFADSAEWTRRHPMPCIFWLAGRFKNPHITMDEHRVTKEFKAEPEHVVWYLPETQNLPDPLPLDEHFRGPVEVITFRSSWDDTNAIFLGLKGGYNHVSHGHLDLGTFELDALGKRWARDLGSDNYNLPGYFDKKDGGKRWSYYRLRSESHNVLMIDGKDQDVGGTSQVKTFKGNVDEPCAIVEIKTAYKDFANDVTRGISLVNGRKALLVQDEISLKKPCPITWGMTTDAEIKVGKNGFAILRIDDKQLQARVLKPEGANFKVESAEQEPPQKRNKGVRRLIVRLDKPEKKDLTIAVLLSPVWDEKGKQGDVEVKPLGEW